ASGEGTAQRIKELIERAVNKRQETELEVLALSIVEVKEELPVIQKEYQIIAPTGITDLNIQAPFIPLERFIDQNIEVILDQLLMESEMEETEFVSLDEETAKKTCVEFISENFIFINGSKLIDPMWQFSTQVSQTMGIGNEEYGFKINLVMHTAGMIERIIRNETLTVEENELTNTMSDPLYNQLTASVVLLEDKIKVKVPIEEMYYLLRLVHNQLDKKEYTMP
uniref:PRD domain-containing protein n=1 Tax=Enterococcus lactis TaxID=357441 RepID=UPI0022DF7098